MPRYPRFQEAIKALSRDLPTGTYWRYANGQLPTFGRFLADNPELAQALADDAAELAQKQTSNGAVITEQGE